MSVLVASDLGGMDGYLSGLEVGEAERGWRERKSSCRCSYCLISGGKLQIIDKYASYKMVAASFLFSKSPTRISFVAHSNHNTQRKEFW